MPLGLFTDGTSAKTMATSGTASLRMRTSASAHLPVSRATRLWSLTAVSTKKALQRISRHQPTIFSVALAAKLQTSAPW